MGTVDEYNINKKNVKIKASHIELGENVTFGDNININIHGILHIGDYSHIGDDATIKGNNISFGDHLYNSSGLRIGGGGAQNPQANFSIGDKGVIHNNNINIFEPVILGNDVGLSTDVTLVTHGYWTSVLEGYPQKFEGISIGNNVLIGHRSVVLMGVTIGNDIVIGAQSVISKSIHTSGIWAGNPVRYIKDIIPLPRTKRIDKINDIIRDSEPSAEFHGVSPKITVSYPQITVNNFTLNVESFEYSGDEDIETDDFRDHIRKYGIRIFTKRPFRSTFKKED